LERIRAEVLDALDARHDEPANVADDSTAEAVFGKKHPYGRLPIGTAAGVRALRRDDLVAYHAERYTPSSSVLVIAGDIDPAGIRARLEATLGLWEGPTVINTDAPAIHRAAAAGAFLSVSWEEAAQSEIRFAGVGLPRTSPRWMAAIVANYILGGSTITGRLGANLREDKGWTYGVRSSFAGGIRAAGWVVDTAVGAEATHDAMNEISAELYRLVEEPVSPEELSRAREAMILSLPRAFETPTRIVSRIATLDAFGLPDDYWDTFPVKIAEVSVDDVQEIARDFFTPGELVRVAVGPALEE
jgi:zinc protease